MAENSSPLFTPANGSLDRGLKHFLTALCFLLPLSALAIVLFWPGLPVTALTAQLENVYGFLAIIGLVSFAIVGMRYKVVPVIGPPASGWPTVPLTEYTPPVLVPPPLSMVDQSIEYWAIATATSATNVSVTAQSRQLLEGALGPGEARCPHRAAGEPNWPTADWGQPALPAAVERPPPKSGAEAPAPQTLPRALTLDL